jgi:helicase MOV-10
MADNKRKLTAVPLTLGTAGDPSETKQARQFRIRAAAAARRGLTFEEYEKQSRLNKAATHFERAMREQQVDPDTRQEIKNAAVASTRTSSAIRITKPQEPDTAPSPIGHEPDTSNDSANAAKDDIKWEYDVYARPFIPAALRGVNHEPAQVIVTAPKHLINGTSFVESFSGKAFLPDESYPLAPPFDPALPLPAGAVTEGTFLEHFAAIWHAEYAAQAKENESYAQYKVKIYPLHTEGYYALSIPGLRENSPAVEMGDTLQLRQLWIDQFGQLTAMPTRALDSSGGFLLRCWTGVQYNASVYGINRAAETVYLKIVGLESASSVFNVVLPLKHRHVLAKWNALHSIAHALQQVILGRARTRRQLQNGVSGDMSSQVLNEPEQGYNEWMRRMLFPTEADGVMQTKLRKLPQERGLFNGSLNYEQLQAVNSGCEREFGVLPFLISGPPGTGKTMSLVELAMQLLHTHEVSHILICAPSDQAADTLTQRLSQWLKPKDMLRLNGPQRPDVEVRELLPYCYIENGMFYIPPFKQLMAYNVVVTSTRDAAMLVEARVTNTDLYTIEKNMQEAFHPEDIFTPKPLHWGALLLDEAAQATELDVLPVLSAVMPPPTWPRHLDQPRFVMAGDQNQLGAKTASRDPRVSTSLFARLFDRPLYKDHPLSRSKVRPSAAPPVLKASMLPMLHPPFVNLIRNYRSHPAILSVPSSLFYNNTLIPEAPLEHSPLQLSSLWHGRKWPVLYIPHTGADEIERDDGGWYNVTEANKACDIAQHLVTQSGVAQTDIVIMSPFAAQVKLLRQIMRGTNYGDGAGLWDVNIGPLEAFQGLESRVVIICTTRTRVRFLAADAERGLGIIGQEKKMNVALTRAKSALFVIGNPEVLAADQHWREFLAFCWRNGLVSGTEGFSEEVVDSFKECKVGVLEKALVAKEDLRGRKTLGSAVGVGEEDEMWYAGLNEALDGLVLDDLDDDDDDDDESENDDADEDDEDDDNDEGYVDDQEKEGEEEDTDKDEDEDDYEEEHQVHQET